jgi:hypothetical protein
MLGFADVLRALKHHMLEEMANPVRPFCSSREPTL